MKRVASYPGKLWTGFLFCVSIGLASVSISNAQVAGSLDSLNGTSPGKSISSSGTGNNIDAFNFAVQFEPDIVGSINQTSKTINLVVPYSQAVTSLIASFTLSPLATLYVGTTVQISGTTPNDFTQPVNYICEAQNGSREIYIVTVTHAAPSSEKQLLDYQFVLPGGPAVGVVTEADKTVVVHVPFGTDITNLVGYFVLSPYASAQVNGQLQYSGVTPHSFTNPLIYSIIAEDGSISSYTVTVIIDLNHEKRFLSFNFNGFVPPVVGLINESAKTVLLKVPYSTNLSTLTNVIATFAVSTHAIVWISEIQQVSGVTPNSFVTSLIYTVEAQDHSLQDYTVTVTNDLPSTEARLTDFRFITPTFTSIGIINEGSGTIALTVPFSTNLSSMVATFTNSPFSTVRVGSVIQISGVTPNSFIVPATYQVTSESGAIKNYSVSVSKAPASSEKVITAFNFETQFHPDIVGEINQTTKTIRLTVPFSQNVTSLVPTFTNSPFSSLFVGTTQLISGTTAADFTNPVDVTCRAEDGSNQVYRVTLTRAPASSEKNILDFRFNGLSSEAVGTISGTTISVQVSGDTDVTHLVAVFTLSPYAFVKVGGATQISGTTPNDFTRPVIYTVVAEDNSERSYTVNVYIGRYAGKRMLTFGFPTVAGATEGIIDEINKTIVVYIPFSASRAALTASFTSSERSTVWIGTTRQVSGLTVNDFNAVRTYTVKADDNSTQDYQVTVLKSLPLNGNQIITYRFAGLSPAVDCVIDQTARTIVCEVPFGTPLTALVATFTQSPMASVSLAGIAQISGITPNDYSRPLVLRCTSESGLINEYTVSVSLAAASSEKKITYFAFADLHPVDVGVINESERTIKIDLPFGTPLVSLRATFTNSPMSTVMIGTTTQISGTSVNDFSFPVVYTVVAQNGSIAEYTVTVRVLSDTSRPTVTNAFQMVTNIPDQYVVLQSNEPTGKVYIIRSDAPQDSPADLEQSVRNGLGRSGLVIQSDTEIRITTYALDQGYYNTYAIDGAGNMSDRGINSISIIDALAPDVFVQNQVISNGLNKFVNIRSSDNGGYVYLVMEGVPASTRQQLDGAVGSLHGQRAPVGSANVDIPVSVHQLIPGDYKAFAVDLYGNVSSPSTATVIITQANNQNEILSFGFYGLTTPVFGTITGTEISVKVPVGTPVTALVATFTLSPLARAFVGLVQQNNGVSPNNFTNPVRYKIEAEDGSIREYRVTVSFGTSISDFEWFSRIKSYPNPVSDRLMIEMSDPADRIQILNAVGQIMIDQSEQGKSSQQFDVSHLQKGVYFIRYYRNGRLAGAQKVVKN